MFRRRLLNGQRRVVRLILVALLAAACVDDSRPRSSAAAASASSAADVRVVLLTFSGFRGDLLPAYGGDARLTPHLAGLAKRADHVGLAAVAAQSAEKALAGLWTGRLGHASGERPVITEWTLSERLADAGFSTTARWRLRWHDRFADSRLARGFGRARPFQGLRELTQDLEGAAATDGPSFLWIGIDLPGPPLIKEHRSLAQLGPWLDRSRWRRLPDRLSARDLAADNADASRDLYLVAAAQADRFLGRILTQLEASDPGLRRTMLMVTGLNGLHLAGRPPGRLLRDPETAGEGGGPREALLAELLVPLVVLVPESLPEKVRAQLTPGQELVSHLQLLPTLRALTGKSPQTTQLGSWDLPVGWVPAAGAGGLAWFDTDSGELRLGGHLEQPDPDRAAATWRWWSEAESGARLGGRPLPASLVRQLSSGRLHSAPASSPR